MFYQAYRDLDASDKPIFTQILCNRVREALISFNMPSDLMRVRFVVNFLSQGNTDRVSLVEYFELLDTLELMGERYIPASIDKMTPCYGILLRKKCFF